MHLFRTIAAILLAATPAGAEGVVIVSPVYSQLVALPVPEDFVAGSEHEEGGSYILEFTPKGETVEGWSQLITLTGIRDQGTRLSAEEVANRIGAGYQAACPDTFAARVLPPPQVRGAVSVFSGYLGCGAVGGQSEAMVFLVLQGKADVYTVQWAEHGAALAIPPAPDPAIWQPRVDMLALARVCDKVASEGPPYPSCTE